jgi:hypothetical protein
LRAVRNRFADELEIEPRHVGRNRASMKAPPGTSQSAKLAGAAALLPGDVR